LAQHEGPHRLPGVGSCTPLINKGNSTFLCWMEVRRGEKKWQLQTVETRVVAPAHLP
jgi:hypothetical protein